MKILPVEDIIVSSNENKVVLTTERIHMTDTVWGNSYKISIFLEDISSVESKYTSKIIYIVIGVVSVFLGFIASTRESSALIAGLVFGGAFFLMWFMSRKHIISISSKGGSALNFIATGMSSETIDEFVYNVSLAKAAKIKRLYKI